MKDIKIFDILRFPSVQFGEGVKRDVRIIVSPQTTGENRSTFVHCTLPPTSISDGHFHSDGDEYIYFDIGGKAILNGIEYEVPPMGLVHVKSGSMHECINTSSERTLTLYCVFLPALVPYGAYPELIEKTNEYLNNEK